MTEHIEDTRLRTDLCYRFEYLSKFINFTQNDVHILNSLAPIILPALPALVEQIYAKLYSFDITRNYFLLRHDGFENYHPTKNVKCGLLAAQTDYRKDMLSVYFHRIFTQTHWDEAFLQYLYRVGEIHTPNGGSKSINVDYIHINLLLTLIQNSLMNFLRRTDQLEIMNKFEAFESLNKLFCIQNDFFTLHHLATFKSKSLSSVPMINFSKCCFH